MDERDLIVGVLAAQAGFATPAEVLAAAAVTVTFAIIDVGGFLGIGAHRVAIPVNQISAVKPHVVVPGATKEALKSPPKVQYAKDKNQS